MNKTPIPAWLYTPPFKLDRPPVITRKQGLPFDQLDWPDFERLVLRVIAADREILDCRVYGVPGQAQHGIDLLAVRIASPSEQECFQCKRVTNFRASDIYAAIKKFEEGPWVSQASEFSLCVACSLDSTKLTDVIIKERSRLAENNITLRIWDGSSSGELNTRLKDLPEIVDDFFGREWVRVFNGPEEADRISDRLDGYDFSALRERLSELYRVIFTQHDPGLSPGQAEPSDYLQRYVPADITENATVDSSNVYGLGQREIRENKGSKSTDREEDGPQATSSIPSGKYAVRRPAWEWLRDKDDCVVLGEPGHGKSAFLRQLALVLNSKDFVEEMPLGPEHLRRLPVWISFARFAAEISKNTSLSVEDFYCSWLHQYGYEDIQPLFHRALRTSEFVLLVDGLDEATGKSECREALDRIVTFGKSHRAIVICTSRPRPYSSLPIPQSWPSAMLAPLDDRQVEELATRWFAIVERASTEESDEERRARAKPRGQGFSAAIHSSARTLELARNPLLCQALIELYRLSHRLPEARIRAYGEIIDLFLRKHPQARAHAGYTEPPPALRDLRDSDLQDILVRIAFDTQSSSVGGFALRDRCVQLCAEYLKDDIVGLGLTHPKSLRLAPEIIELFVNYFGILIERSPGELSFAHLSLQEFLSAKEITAKPEAAQLKWVRTIALQEQWRECLTSWFGIQGDNGRRSLTAQACRILADLGSIGEWERLQALSLRTELSTSDLGLPVGEARDVLNEAVKEVDNSPFPDFRSKLARYITIGALGGSIKDECEAAVIRWTPGRSYFDRVQILKAFGNWNYSADLDQTLKYALHDERIECRLAAAESYAQVSATNPTAPHYLLQLAKKNIRPEVRAAALHCLAQVPTWSDAASEAAEWDIASHAPELQLTRIALRVKLEQHTKKDLDTLLNILSTDSLAYTLQGKLNSLICDGWPRVKSLRSQCIKFIRQESGMGEQYFPLEYLITSYPNDDEIAGIIAGFLDRHGMHLGIDPGHFWNLLRTGFAGHKAVIEATRKALAKYKKEFSAIFWHPMTIPVFLFLADDQARDELLEGYHKDKSDRQDRYWIATALLEGWSQDSVVQDQIKCWANDSVDLATPLAQYAKYVKPLEPERREWIEWLVRESNDQNVVSPMFELLKEWPDKSSHTLVSERLKGARIWYYNRIELEAKLAATYPECDESRQTVERAFSEADGPSLAIVASAYQDDPAIRQRLLTAAVPAPSDVRLSIATVLKERGGSPDLIERLTPDVLAEETGSVRATTLMARARAIRNDSNRLTSLLEMLSTEANSIGSRMHQRRRTALAALLDMGEAERVAQFMADDKTDLPERWFDLLERDFVSLETLLDHWPELHAAATKSGASLKFPMASYFDAGYGSFLERLPNVRDQLDEYISANDNGLNVRRQLVILSRLHPRSGVLRAALIKTFGSHTFPQSGGRYSCLAARLICEHFGGDEEVLAAVIPKETPSELSSNYPGVLGHLVRSWPLSDYAIAARRYNADERKRWAAIDRLLCATLWGYWDEASTAARELIALRYRYRYVETENTEALRIWAQTDESLQVLSKWRESSDGDEVIAALELFRARASVSMEDEDWLKTFFNQAFVDQSKAPPLDGNDLITGQVIPWLLKAYELLSQTG